MSIREKESNELIRQKDTKIETYILLRHQGSFWKAWK